MEAGARAGLRLVLNGAPRELPGVVTVADLVRHLGTPVERVAVEVDGSIVRKADYATTTLADGARVEVVSFVGGG